jgi:D-apionolactonase
MAQQQAPESIALYGTEEPDEKGRVLRAGSLSVEFQNGQLRYVRRGDKEVMRAVAFIVRDEVWGTYNAEIAQLEIEEQPSAFRIRYAGHCADGAVRYDADITGTEQELIFAARVTVARNFRTNRTGFVILHPLEGCAGRPVEVEHVDGSREHAEFPHRISAYQPFFAVRALKHEFAPGSFVTARLEGDTFEMEDQRNWSDASFKTYVRPIGLPWPYELAAGQQLEQRVSLTIEGRPPAEPRAASARETAITLGGSAGKMPQIGVEIPAAEAAASRDSLALLQALGPRLIVGEVLRQAGHGRREIAAYREIAAACNAGLTLEASLPGTADPPREARELAEECAAAGADIHSLTLWAAPDLKGVLPGSAWPVQPPLEAIRWAALTAFPRARIGGGAHGFFTELNRRRPLAHFLDYISFTTTPIVHAADDRSVMETLETLPAIIASATAIAAGKPWRVGPSGIGTRDNPYGAGPTPNPGNGRVCMADMDPRQRGLFGAAWTVGYLAAFATSGAEAIVLGTGTGPRGAIHRRLAEPLPWFDEAGGGRVYPLFHVLAAAAAASGAEVLATTSSAPRQVAALGWRDGKASRLLLANLTPEAQRVSLSGVRLSGAECRMLDAGAFAAATAGPDWAKRPGAPLGDGRIALSRYAVAFVTLGAA